METTESFVRKPSWLKVKFPSGETWKKVENVLARRALHTVCDEAHCPNKGECWGMGTATFMILGDVCTRGCRFCAVSAGLEGRPVERNEGERIAEAARELGLDYVVITSVDRDDLADRGAGHFASCVRAIRAVPRVKIEALIPDYYGAELDVVTAAVPDVIAHNVETMRSLQHIRDGRASFDKSLRTLREIHAAGITAKSSILLGLGEREEEVLSTMDELRGAGVDILVLGQYLRPTQRQIPVAEYVTPERFERYAEEARVRGFSSVVSAPLARTSYHAKAAARPAYGGCMGSVTRLEGVGRPEGCKLIRVSADIADGIIHSISIRGDFFASPVEGFERAEARLAGVPAAEAGSAFDRFLAEEGVEAFGIHGAGLAVVLAQAAAHTTPTSFGEGERS
jgi:lipoic acid synthetase